MSEQHDPKEKIKMLRDNACVHYVTSIRLGVRLKQKDVSAVKRLEKIELHDCVQTGNT